VHHPVVDAAPLRVVIAEDSALIREGIARLIEESGGTVVAKVGDGPSLVKAVVEHRPDVSVVDVRMPPSQRDEGLRAAIEARRQVPGTPVLVLSQYVERLYARELMQFGDGAVGYLLKDRVAAGGTVLDPKVVTGMLSQAERSSAVARLTAREREVLGLMAQGLSNAAIASSMVVTDKAVGKHISNIFMKLDLPDVPDHNGRVLAVLKYLQQPE